MALIPRPRYRLLFHAADGSVRGCTRLIADSIPAALEEGVTLARRRIKAGVKGQHCIAGPSRLLLSIDRFVFNGEE